MEGESLFQDADTVKSVLVPIPHLNEPLKKQRTIKDSEILLNGEISHPTPAPWYYISHFVNNYIDFTQLNHCTQTVVLWQ